MGTYLYICTKELAGIVKSINNWQKRRYPKYKLRVVSKNELEKVKMQQKKETIKLIFGKF